MEVVIHDYSLLFVLLSGIIAFLFFFGMFFSTEMQYKEK